MLSRMSSRELTEWLAYMSIEPIGEQREDYRSARLLSMLANIHRDTKQKREPFQPADFLVDFWAVRNDASDRRSKQAELLGKMRFLADLAKAHHTVAVVKPRKQ